MPAGFYTCPALIPYTNSLRQNGVVQGICVRGGLTNWQQCCKVGSWPIFNEEGKGKGDSTGVVTVMGVGEGRPRGKAKTAPWALKVIGTILAERAQATEVDGRAGASELDVGFPLRLCSLRLISQTELETGLFIEAIFQLLLDEMEVALLLKPYVLSNGRFHTQGAYDNEALDHAHS